MNVKLSVSVFLVCVMICSARTEAKPKYGPAGSPKAIPLHDSNDYFRKPINPAPQFWALISYYVPQKTHSTCSLATAVMALNAALSQRPQTSEDALLEEGFLQSTIDKNKWDNKARDDAHESRLGLLRYVASLDQYRYLMTKAFQSYQFEKVNIQAIHVNDRTSETKRELKKHLQQFSQSKNYFILANFNQQAFTDDADVGHYAPVGAYDSEKNRVLILDPDREYYEPYWVSVDDFIGGMNTKDTGVGKFRGYLWVSLAGGS